MFLENERQHSAFNFEHADVDMLIEWFKGAEKQCMALLSLEKPLPLPAYDWCLKASHLFNLVDARGAISVAERASWIARVRELANGIIEAQKREIGEMEALIAELDGRAGTTAQVSQ